MSAHLKTHYWEVQLPGMSVRYQWERYPYPHPIEDVLVEACVFCGALWRNGVREHADGEW